MKHYVKVSELHQNILTEWLWENNIEDYSFWVSAWKNHPYRYLFEFDYEDDAAAFKLRFGE